MRRGMRSWFGESGGTNILDAKMSRKMTRQMIKQGHLSSTVLSNQYNCIEKDTSGYFKGGNTSLKKK